MLNKKFLNNVFLVDSTGFVLKYWFVVPPVKTENYESIAAFLGFIGFVIRLLHDYQPKYISFAFDESLGSCFRNKIYSDYKKTREKAPDELKAQFKLCREFLTLMGLDNNASKTHEADDILYTIAKNTKQLKLNNIVLTNDKDLYQLIHKDDVWWNYGDKRFTYEELIKKLNFSPQDLSDYLGLMGDSADNIPGAPGLGEKTASALMGEYKTLDNIVNNLETIPAKIGSKYNRFIKIIEENKKIIYLSKKLATLDYIDDMKKNFKDLERSMIDINKIDSFFKETGMRESQKDSWIKDIQKLVVT